jgi:hypothetical protein
MSARFRCFTTKLNVLSDRLKFGSIIAEMTTIDAEISPYFSVIAYNDDSHRAKGQYG